MDKIEEVKKILVDNTYNFTFGDKPIDKNLIGAFLNIDKAAQEICQLFELKPKISPFALPSQAYNEYLTLLDENKSQTKEIVDQTKFGMPWVYGDEEFHLALVAKTISILNAEIAYVDTEPKTDESRMQNLKEMRDAIGIESEPDSIMRDLLSRVASLKDAECQARVEGIMGEIEEAFGDWLEDKVVWQALKKREGVE